MIIDVLVEEPFLPAIFIAWYDDSYYYIHKVDEFANTDMYLGAKVNQVTIAEIKDCEIDIRSVFEHTDKIICFISDLISEKYTQLLVDYIPYEFLPPPGCKLYYRE